MKQSRVTGARLAQLFLSWQNKNNTSRSAPGRIQVYFSENRTAGFWSGYRARITCLSIPIAIGRLCCRIRRRTWGGGLFVITISRLGGSLAEGGLPMLHYIAIVEDA